MAHTNFNDDTFNDPAFGFFVEDKLLENVRQITRYADRWQMRCPICGDSKNTRIKRFWYYRTTVTAHCWNGSCVASEKGLPILKILSLVCDESISDLKFQYLKSINKPRVAKRKVEIIKPPPTPKVELLDSWVDVDDKIQKYIDHRQILKAPFAPKNWHFYYDKNKKRLVIPWLVDGKMPSYQLRAIYKGQDPKYLFPFNVEKHVFGIDNIDEELPYVFMLEGAFDSVWVKNGVSIGGLTPTENQLNKIRLTLCEPVYFFDNQYADKTSYTKSIKLATEEPTAKIFIWPRNIKEKDCNEHVIKTGKNPFKDKEWLISHISSGLKALMQLKMD